MDKCTHTHTRPSVSTSSKTLWSDTHQARARVKPSAYEMVGFDCPTEYKNAKDWGIQWYPSCFKHHTFQYFSYIVKLCVMLILSARHMIKAKQMYQRKIGVSRALLSNSVMLCVCVCPWLSYGTGQWTEKAWLLNHSCDPGVHNNAAWNGCR